MRKSHSRFHTVLSVAVSGAALSVIGCRQSPPPATDALPAVATQGASTPAAIAGFPTPSTAATPPPMTVDDLQRIINDPNASQQAKQQAVDQMKQQALR